MGWCPCAVLTQKHRSTSTAWIGLVVYLVSRVFFTGGDAMSEDTVTTRGAFFALPSTTLGRMSAMLLVLDVVLIVLTVTFFDALNEIGPSWPGTVVAGAIGASMLAGIITGATALIGRRERSWVVWVSCAVPAIVLGVEVVQIASSGGGVASADATAGRAYVA